MIYEESGMIGNGTSIKPFVEVILPLLQIYGVSSDSPEGDISQNCVYGTPQGCRIEVRYSGGYVDPYTGGSNEQTLESFQLVHPISGEKLKLIISIEDIIWSHTEIKLRFEGEASEIERLKKAISPVLQQAILRRSILSNKDRDSELKELEEEAIHCRTPERLVELSKHPRFYIRMKVASNPGTPPFLLESLATDTDMMVREAVAANRYTPPETLTSLAKDVRRYVRRNVAANQNTPPAALESLATYHDYYVPRYLAGNPSTPASVLEAFAQSKDYTMRAIVANNPSAPLSVLEVLARDEHLYVRLEVGRNKSTPRSLYESLAKEVEEADDAD